MSNILQFPTPARKQINDETQKFLEKHVVDSDREFMEKHKLGFEKYGDEGYMFVGNPFITPNGVVIEKSYGYLKPTGKYVVNNGREEIEVICICSKLKKYVSVELLEPFRMIDRLEE